MPTIRSGLRPRISASGSVRLVAFVMFAWLVMAGLGRAAEAAGLNSQPNTIRAIGIVSAASPTLALSVAKGRPGTAVTITGSGYPPGEVVAIYIDLAEPYLLAPPPGPRADPQGTFTAHFVWPDNRYDTSGRIDPSKPGPHMVCGDTAYSGSTQAVTAKACAQFEVLAGPSPSPTPGQTLPPAETPGPPVSTVLVVLVIFLALAGGAAYLMRRTQ